MSDRVLTYHRLACDWQDGQRAPVPDLEDSKNLEEQA